MRDIDVSSTNWSGAKNETFNWSNQDTADNIISDDGSTWPFTLASPITVSASTKKSCGLGGTSGTYTYRSNGNPKSVIIS